MKDMRTFLDQVERERPQEFIRVKKEIDPKYEITALVKKLDREDRYPVLYFEKVKGSRIPIVCNLYGTRSRLGRAIGTTAQDLADEFRKREDNPIEPKLAPAGPCQEVVLTGAKVDVTAFPVMTHHQWDAAPYITTGIVLAKEPDTGVYNASFGRLMLVDSDTVYTHVTPGRHLFHYYSKAEDRGQALPAAICIGTHPAHALGALSLVSVTMDELHIMGAMAQEPVELVKCKTVDVEVPAGCEIVLEGEILPKVRGKEGPFCEFTGYAIGQRERHVFKIKAITHRKEPIYQGLSAGSTEHLLIGAIAREAYQFRAAHLAVPTVKAIHVPLSGTGRFHSYVAIEKKAKGQPKNVALAIMGADLNAKHVIVVDEDIDVFDEQHVLWAMATRVQGDRDVIIIPDTRGSDLDPSASEDGVVARVIIDATAKPSLEEFPRRAQVPQQVMERIRIEDYLPE